MAINCSNNAALDKLQAAKDALNAQLDGLASAGTAGLEALESALSQFEDDLKAALPKPPELPNFKKQLDALKGLNPIDLAAAKAKLKETWGDALPDIDIDALVGNLTMPQLPGLPSFDFCKDVPNIEGTVDPVTGKIASVKDKGAEPTTATEPAKAAEAVTPTVADSASKPSQSSRTDKSLSELLDGVQAYRDEDSAYEKTLYKGVSKQYDKVAKIKRSSDYRKLNKKFKKAAKEGTITGGSSYYNTLATADEKATLEKYWTAYIPWAKSIAEYKAYKSISATFYMRAPYEDQEEMIAGVRDLALNGYKSEYRKTTVTNGVASSETIAADLTKLLDDAEAMYRKHQTAIIEYKLYDG